LPDRCLGSCLRKKKKHIEYMKKIAITQNMNLAEDMLEKLEEASINAELKNGEDSASVWGSVTMSNLEIWVDDENDLEHNK